MACTKALLSIFLLTPCDDLDGGGEAVSAAGTDPVRTVVETTAGVEPTPQASGHVDGIVPPVTHEPDGPPSEPAID